MSFADACIKVQDMYLKLQMWDTAGQEKFKAMSKIYYRGAHAAVLCYSIDDRESFESLPDWIETVRDQCYEDVLIFLVGNKKDLESERKVSVEDALRFQRENGIKYYVETSAKTGDGIE